MAYLIAILVALALFGGFIALTVVERKNGKRFLGGVRATLDGHVANAAGVAKSADPLDFIIRGGRVVAGHIFHDVANVAWAVVRMLERTLSGTVRKLRHMRQAPPGVRGPSKLEESMNRAPEGASKEETTEIR